MTVEPGVAVDRGSADAVTGLVCFFDILGYQNLLLRREPEAIAGSVLPIIEGVGKKVVGRLKSLIASVPNKTPLQVRAMAEGVVEQIQWMIFSDTIVMTLGVPEGDENRVHWVALLAAAAGVYNELFEAGLPVRGAVEYGKYVAKGNCFAGKAIISAYHLTHRLELAACVLGDEAAARATSLKWPAAAVREEWLTEYLVPMKEGDAQMPVLRARPFDKTSTNVRREVLLAFWGNGKDIPRSVQAKVTNTEQWFEFLIRQDDPKPKAVTALDAAAEKGH